MLVLGIFRIWMRDGEESTSKELSLQTMDEAYGSMTVQYYLQLVIPRVIHSTLQLQIRHSKQWLHGLMREVQDFPIHN